MELVLILCMLIIIMFISAILTSQYSKWKKYLNRTKKKSVKYGETNFEVFKEEVNKRSWENSRKYSLVEFCELQLEVKSEVSEKVIMFNKKGMLLNFWDYIKAMKYKTKKLESINRPDKGVRDDNLWKGEDK